MQHITHFIDFDPEEQLKKINLLTQSNCLSPLLPLCFKKRVVEPEKKNFFTKNYASRNVQTKMMKEELT